MQHTFNCKNGLVLVKPVNPTQLQRPSHCPCCHTTKISITETNGWDEYALRLNTSRQFAILILNKFDRAVDLVRAIPSKSSSTTNTPYQSPKYTKKALSNVPNAELAERSMQGIPEHLVHGTCFIHAGCTACASSFEFQISSPDNPQNPTLQTNHRPLTYCPYCGTPTLVLMPATQSWTERSEQEWQFLADHYNQSTLAIRAYYQFWEKHSTLHTFKQFMEDLPNQFKLELTDRHTRRTQIANATVRPRKSASKTTRKIKIVVKKNVV